MEELLEAVEKILQDKVLDSIQSFVLYQSWLGKTYDEMAEGTGYGRNYIKQVGSQLWQDLSQAAGERVTKKNLHLVLSKYSQGMSLQQNQPQQSNKNFRLPKLDPNFFAVGKIEFPSGPVSASSNLYINRPPLEELICQEILHSGC
ncbi:MAG: hypothetical protein RMX96_35065, partial [Nostoc sp. ChiSLP02]|nr:hypothetical protein [Nostoc sp. ChiSLP02]